jgi:hypothetical protein
VITNGTGTNATFTTNPAPYITAVLTTSSTTTNQLVFSFEYSTLTTTTNITTPTNTTVTFPTFSNKNKLVLVSPLDGSASPTNPPTFAVQEGSGKNITLVDVSAFIYFTADPGVTDVNVKGVDYNILVLHIGATAANGTFITTADSFTKETFGAKVHGQTINVPKAFEADPAGAGTFAGNALIVQGKVTASGGASGPALTAP